MDSVVRKTALITGASSGIGRELAKLFAADGHDLVVVGRTAEELEAFAQECRDQHGIRTTVIVKDLFEPGAARELYEEIRERGLVIDFLVNDAGQGVYGPFAETNLEQELAIVQLNVCSLLTLTKLFLKDMLARNEGRILQLASLTSTVPTPLSAVYSGTKAFVYNFSLALRNELRDSKVTITALQPGATDTDFFQKEGAEHAAAVEEGMLAPPKKVASDGYRAMMKGEGTVVSGLGNKVLDAAGRLAPQQAATIMRLAHEPRHRH